MRFQCSIRTDLPEVHASHTVTDSDVGRLIAAGSSEDQIFEVTAAAAVGAARRSFCAGRDVLGRDTG